MTSLLKLFPYMLYMWLLPRYSNCCLFISNMLRYTLLPYIERMLKRVWECLYEEHIDTWCLLQAEDHERHFSEGHVCKPMCGYFNPDKCDCPYCTLKDSNLALYARGMLLVYIKAHQGMSIHGFYTSTHVCDLDVYSAIEYMLSKGIIVGPALLSCPSHEDMRYMTASYMDSLCTTRAYFKAPLCEATSTFEHYLPDGIEEGTHDETLCSICTPYPEKEN